MGLRRIVLMVAALACLVPSQAGAMADVNLGDIRIVEQNGLLTTCSITLTHGTSGGAPRATTKATCTRDVPRLYSSANLHRHTPSSAVMGYDSDSCQWCRTVSATAVASCYGGCPSGFSWKGEWGNHWLVAVDYPIGSTVTPPPGAICHISITQTWCEGEAVFNV